MSRTCRILACTTAAAFGLAATAGAAGAPTITSLTATQKGNKVTVKIKTRNFTIDAAGVGKKNRSGRGHQHFAMDGGKYDFPRYSGANGKLAQQLGVQGTYSPSLNDRVTYTGLPRGRHTVVVHLVRNTHANYGNAGARKRLTFTVR